MQTAVSRSIGSRITRGVILCLMLAALLTGARSAIRAQAGSVWAWGYNVQGELGDGTNTQRYLPIQPSGITGMTQVAGGGYHSLALRADGTVWAWGSNDHGQLGDGNNINSNTPVPVTGLADAGGNYFHMTQVAGGLYHSLALKSDGTVWAWGDNRYGALGDGTNSSSTTPVQVSGMRNIVQVSGGALHSLALRADGTVWAWGNNDYGQLGDGTTSNGYYPVRVSGLTGVTQVAGGSQHALAVKSDGTVWAWGNNIYGQLGDGTKTSSYTPVQVTGLTGVTQVVGGYHSLALKSDGTVWAWGLNDNGQLGDGTKTTSYTPVQVTGLTGVVQVSAGYKYSLALKSGGTVWAWGLNDNGQLGDGTTADETTPVQSLDLPAQNYIAAGDAHTLSLTGAPSTTTLSIYNAPAQYGGPITLFATLSNGQDGIFPFAKKISFTVDGVPLGSAYTDQTAVARFLVSNTLGYALGAHVVTVSFAGDANYKPSTKTATFKIAQAVTAIKIGAVSGQIGASKNITATLKRASSGTAVSSATLTFKFDGNVIGTADTDGTGTATLPYYIDEIALGAHTLTAEYTGDSNHKATIGKGVLTVSKAGSKLSATSLTGKNGTTVNLAALLTRTTDSAGLVGRTVSFQIDGVDAGSVTTDANGLASLSYTINLTVGTHKIGIFFDGDASYIKSSNIKATLKVK